MERVERARGASRGRKGSVRTFAARFPRADDDVNESILAAVGREK